MIQLTSDAASVSFILLRQISLGQHKNFSLHPLRSFILIFAMLTAQS